jgi:exodeoxyribonuclease-3
MRIISLSVDGIHQSAQQGLFEWLAGQDADIICLQDLRALEHDLDHAAYQLDGFHAYFFDAGTKQRNGVGIYTRKQPKALIYGFGFPSGVDMDGRYLQADFDNISIGSLLAPTLDTRNPGNLSAEVKTKFFDDLQCHLDKISRKRRDFIFCGNWAMARSADDIENAHLHEDDCGYLVREQQWMDQLVNQLDYTDAFRQANEDCDEYSYYPSGTIGEGDGWRTDTHIISRNLDGRVEYATIYKNKTFSSHRPVIIDYDLEV